MPVILSTIVLQPRQEKRLWASYISNLLEQQKELTEQFTAKESGQVSNPHEAAAVYLLQLSGNLSDSNHNHKYEA